MLIAFLMAALMNLFAWFNSGTAALRAYRARVVTQAEAPQLYEVVDRLRQRAGLPMPRLRWRRNPSPTRSPAAQPGQRSGLRD